MVSKEVDAEMELVRRGKKLRIKLRPENLLRSMATEQKIEFISNVAFNILPQRQEGRQRDLPQSEKKTLL